MSLQRNIATGYDFFNGLLGLLPFFVLNASEHIPRPAHREHTTRMARIVLDGGPDTGDVHVDAAIEGFQLLAFDSVHELLARQNPTGVVGECHQKIELIARQRARLPSS